MLTRTLAWVLILGGANLACVTSDDFGRCDGTMAITTVAGAVPEIQWSPAGCEVYQVTVDQSGSITWAVTMTQTKNGIGSSVTYGTAPTGTQGSQVVPLTLGPYRVVLTRIDELNRIYTAAQGTFSYQ